MIDIYVEIVDSKPKFGTKNKKYSNIGVFDIASQAALDCWLELDGPRN